MKKLFVVLLVILSLFTTFVSSFAMTQEQLERIQNNVKQSKDIQKQKEEEQKTKLAEIQKVKAEEERRKKTPTNSEILLGFLIVTLGISAGFAAKYSKDILQMKQQYKKFQNDFSNHYKSMSKQEQINFMNSLSAQEQVNFNNILNNQAMHMMNTFMLQEQIRQFNQWAMDDSIKSVTPFDAGGYVTGEGFNPSDTMIAEANHQMEMDMQNQMNDMNNHMHNM